MDLSLLSVMGCHSNSFSISIALFVVKKSGISVTGIGFDVIFDVFTVNGITFEGFISFGDDVDPTVAVILDVGTDVAVNFESLVIDASDILVTVGNVGLGNIVFVLFEIKLVVE